MKATPVKVASISTFEALLEGPISPEEKLALSRVLQRWANGDPEGFPAQIALLTRAQWRAAARVPAEVQRLLAEHRKVAAAAAEEIRAVASEKLHDLRGVEQTASALEALILRLDAGGDAALARLEAVAQAHAQAARRAEAAARRNDLWALAIAFLIVAGLSVLVGVLLTRWHWGV